MRQIVLITHDVIDIYHINTSLSAHSVNAFLFCILPSYFDSAPIRWLVPLDYLKYVPLSTASSWKHIKNDRRTDIPISERKRNNRL